MFVYTTRTMFPSAKALAVLLSERMGEKVRVTANPDTTLKGLMIRWGVSTPTSRGHKSINSPEYIGIASNKRSFSEEMTNLSIPCVCIESGTPKTFPVVIRRTLTGYGGAGISICHNAQEWNTYGSPYWSAYRRFSIELGVHIFNGDIIKVFKKVRENNLPQEEFPIRNASRGYHFSLVDVNNYPKLPAFVENFNDKFPIMFGRADIGWDVDEKTYRIIEFNTAPCLTNNSDTLDAYTSAFEEIL